MKSIQEYLIESSNLDYNYVIIRVPEGGMQNIIGIKSDLDARALADKIMSNKKTKHQFYVFISPNQLGNGYGITYTKDRSASLFDKKFQDYLEKTLNVQDGDYVSICDATKWNGKKPMRIENLDI